MSLRLVFLTLTAVLLCAGAAWAQPGATLSGQLPQWREGEAEVLLLLPRHVPPPFTRPADALVVGAVDASGVFTITLPEAFPRDGYVPVGEFLDPECTEARVSPADATYVPIAYGAYGPDGRLIGEIFQASSAHAGPAPGEYSILSGLADAGFEIRGACADDRRRVVEDYDFSVGAGWHDIVQRFARHPDRDGWRIDRWRNEEVPGDAVWTLLRPPG